MEHLRGPGRNRSCMPAPVESTPPTPPPPPVPQFPVHASSDGLREMLSAGRGVPRATEARHVMEGPAIHRAVQILINPISVGRRQWDHSHLGQVRKSLCGSRGTDVGGIDTTGYGLDDNDVFRYADEKGRKLPAIPESMVADVLYSLWFTLCTGTQK